MADGVFAETTMIYKDKEFIMLDWTYPDYHSPAALELLNNARKILMYYLTGERINARHKTDTRKS
jgi:hypothetical protein